MAVDGQSEHRGALLMTLSVFLDFETRSCLDLKKHGGWAYAAHPTTGAVCCYLETPRGDSYFWTPARWDGLEMPAGVQYEHGMDFMRALFSDDVQIIAHNGDGFDRAIAEVTLGLPTVQWFDPIALANYYGFPAGLDDLANHLWGERKDMRGYKLMLKLCKPQADGRYIEPTVRDMYDLAVYNVRDVALMRRFCEEYGHQDETGRYAIVEPDSEYYRAHQKTNRRGVRVDIELAGAMIRLVEKLAVRAEKEAVEVTHDACRRAAAGEAVLWPPQLDPIKRGDLTRVGYLQTWINAWGEGLGWSIDDMTKDETLEPMMLAPDDVVPPVLKAVIGARLVVNRAGTKKLIAAVNRVSPDGRLRSAYLYHGALTGRATSKGVQISNLPRPAQWSGLLVNGKKPKTPEEKTQTVLEQGIRLTIAGDAEGFAALVKSIRKEDGSIPKPAPTEQALLNSMVRSIFVPETGKVLVVADYSQIEARGAPWLAGDERELDTFRAADAKTGPDPYCAQASMTFGRTITKDDKVERDVGKQQKLSCQYGLGGPRFDERCEAAGIDLKALGLSGEACVQIYRETNRWAPRTWRELGAALQFHIENPGRRPQTVARCVIECANGLLRITLPSGRKLHYWNPQYGPAEKPKWENHMEITYANYRKSEDGGTKKGIHGALALENVTQASCNDFLRQLHIDAEARGYDCVMHTYDEIILEVDEAIAKEAQAWLDAAMSTAPAWAEGFPIKGESVIMKRYGKG
jgi:DNA polymerase